MPGNGAGFVVKLLVWTRRLRGLARGGLRARYPLVMAQQNQQIQQDGGYRNANGYPIAIGFSFGHQLTGSFLYETTS